MAAMASFNRRTTAPAAQTPYRIPPTVHADESTEFARTTIWTPSLVVQGAGDWKTAGSVPTTWRTQSGCQAGKMRPRTGARAATAIVAAHKT
jgi:hypothetical protein